MFGKLKDKLKGVLNAFSKKVDEEAEEVVETVEKKPETAKKPDVEKKEKKIQDKKKPVSEKKEPIPKKEVDKKVKTTKKSDSEKKEAISKKVDEEPVHTKKEDKSIAEQEPLESDLEEELKTPEEQRKGFFKKIFSKKEKQEIEVLEQELDDLKQESELEKLKKDSEPELVEEIEELEKEIDKERLEKEEEVEDIEEKKGFFSRLSDSITKKKISSEKFDELFSDVEIVLLENNVSFDVVEKIKEDMKQEIAGKTIARKEIFDTVIKTLKNSFSDLLDIEGIDIFKESENKKPYVISFIGINGSGKTTQLAKIAKLILDKKKSVVVAAGDTFRSAAIQQLQEHTDSLGIKLIKHDYGADASAVAYDAVEHAKAKKFDFVLIDTAGRLHSNENLMNELQKLMRVIKPDLNLFVGESITGNDCIEQVTQFSEKIRIDGIILTKADIDEKGGTAISISYVTKKPILFIGMGQNYSDLKPFKKEIILDNLGL